MLSRHFLRSKVLQSLYSCYVNPIELVNLELGFKANIARFNCFGVMQLSILSEARQVAERVLDDLSHKFNPTEAEKHPSARFLENRFIKALEENLNYRQQKERYKISWALEEDLFYSFFLEFRTTKCYEDYINSADTFESDHEFAIQIFKALVMNSSIRASICEHDIMWEDDYDQVAQYNYMMLKTFDSSFDAATVLPMMYDERMEKDVADFDFAFQLLREAYLQRDENEKLIKSHLKGWEFERVAVMDLVIVNMAVAEVTTFSTIPERVTIDEYIELAKEFSTDRSKLFVNGILDRMFAELRASGRINKVGRGIDAMDDAEE